MLTVRELTSDDEVRDAFPLMAQLRDRITADTFLDLERRSSIKLPLSEV